MLGCEYRIIDEVLASKITLTLTLTLTLPLPLTRSSPPRSACPRPPARSSSRTKPPAHPARHLRRAYRSRMHLRSGAAASTRPRSPSGAHTAPGSMGSSEQRVAYCVLSCSPLPESSVLRAVPQVQTPLVRRRTRGYIFTAFFFCASRDSSSTAGRRVPVVGLFLPTQSSAAK